MSLCELILTESNGEEGRSPTWERCFRRSRTFGALDGAAVGHSPQKMGKCSRKVTDLPHIGRQSRKRGGSQESRAAKERDRKGAGPQGSGTARERDRKGAGPQGSGAAKEPKRLVVKAY
jgi:hypothetical protein